jgi:hypothetical protein
MLFKILLIFLLIIYLIIVVILIWPLDTSINIEKMKNTDITKKKVVLCFMVRNGDKYIRKNLEKINNFLKINFDVNHILYIENDSSDKTRSILKNLEQKMPLTGKMLDLNNEMSTQMCKNSNEYNCNTRTQFLGKLRQKLVDIVKTDFYNYDYMMMCDLDFVHFDFNELKNMIQISEYNNYDAIFGMSLKYDKNNNHYKTYDTGAITPSSHRRIYTHSFKKRQTVTNVSSAFSGFGIYSIKQIIKKNANYDIKSKQIEHVNFNKNLNTYVYNNFTPIFG